MCICIYVHSNDALARVIAQALCNDDEEGLTQELFTSEFASTFPQSIRFLRAADNAKWMYQMPPCDPAFLHLIMHPFDRCPRTPLGVLLMASPFLGPLLSKSLSDFIMIYQQDALFKAVFSQVISLSYHIIPYHITIVISHHCCHVMSLLSYHYVNPFNTPYQVMTTLYPLNTLYQSSSRTY